MKEQFVTYEIALAMKKLRFNKECLAYYNIHKSIEPFVFGFQDHNEETIKDDNICSAPLWQQVIDWFREKCRYDIQIKFPHSKTNKVEGINSVYYDIEIYYLYSGDAMKIYKFLQISDDYCDAREKAILKAIEICKKEK